MKLKLDANKTYAIALEGGGARGAYEIGVWKALKEAGIKFNAVSGTSVGALNGALYAMQDLNKAIDIWQNINMSDVVTVNSVDEDDLKKIVSGEFRIADVQEMLPKLADIMKNRGLDVSPLRQWIKDVVDVKKLKKSGIDLYVSTFSLTEKRGLEIKVNDLPDGSVWDMLLASAYHPAFKLEKLGGKLYIDGGFFDTIPIHSLVKNGCKDIIAVRLPSTGIEKRFRMPKDVRVTTISTNHDLGGSLTFDADISRRNLIIGYMDAKRVLYGLYGKKFYIERTLSDRDALLWLIDYNIVNENEANLRELCEYTLPMIARRLEVREGDYYELMIAVLEREALALDIDPFKIRTDKKFMQEIKDTQKIRYLQ